MTNNVVEFAKYKKKPSSIDDLWPVTHPYDSFGYTQADYIYYNSDRWAYLHQSDYEKKITTLVNEGIIKAGKVVMDEHGIPTVYVTMNTDDYYKLDYTIDDTITEANNT